MVVTRYTQVLSRSPVLFRGQNLPVHRMTLMLALRFSVRGLIRGVGFVLGPATGLAGADHRKESRRRSGISLTDSVSELAENPGMSRGRSERGGWGSSVEAWLGDGGRASTSPLRISPTAASLSTVSPSHSSSSVVSTTEGVLSAE